MKKAGTDRRRVPFASGERADNPIEAEDTVRRVKHHVSSELPVVYFQFSADADLASLTIDYKLVAANLPQAQQGHLDVHVTLADLKAPPNPLKVLTDSDQDD